MRAIANVGTVGKLAVKIGTSPRTVETWVFRKNGVPDRSIKLVPRIEKVSGVSRRDLAPLVYPNEPEAAE